MPDLTIGRLAAATGCKVPTIRYYERIGLLPPPRRSAGNQRLYEARHLQRLAFIRHARELGFALPAIRDLLDLNDRPEQSCAAVDAVAREHLDAVEARIARLQRLRGELRRMIAACAGGRVADCRILETLSETPAGMS